MIGHRHSLRRKAILLFAFLITLTLAFGGVLFTQADNIVPASLGDKGSVLSLESGEKSVEKAATQFRFNLRKTILMMTLLMTGGLLGSMLYFLRRVIIPLEDLQKSTLQLAEGKLDALEHLVANTTGPIKGIMEDIHDLAINLQEVLMLVWNLSARAPDAHGSLTGNEVEFAELGIYYIALLYAIDIAGDDENTKATARAELERL